MCVRAFPVCLSLWLNVGLVFTQFSPPRREIGVSQKAKSKLEWSKLPTTVRPKPRLQIQSKKQRKYKRKKNQRKETYPIAMFIGFKGLILFYSQE